MDDAEVAPPKPELLARAELADAGVDLASPAAVVGAPVVPAAPVLDFRGAGLAVVEDWAPAIRGLLPPACAARMTPEQVQRIGIALGRTAERLGWTWLLKADNPMISLGRELYVVADPVVTPFILSKLAPPGGIAAPGDPGRPAPVASIAAPDEAAGGALVVVQPAASPAPAIGSADRPGPGIVKEVRSGDSVFRVHE